MRHQSSSIVAALIALGAVGGSSLAPLHSAQAQPHLAQAPAPTFSLPESFPTDGVVRLQGSPTMAVINQALAAQIEANYSGAHVQLETTSSDAAIADLLAGDIDVAAVERSLTEEEQAQGLVAVPIDREKIAIILGPDNPFNGNLTFEQFASMFRGEITDWSEVGGPPGPIRFVDRPDNSDTRLSLSKYTVFAGAPFATGNTATQVAADDTPMVIQELGADGISYAIASQVLGQNTVKIVPMHQTLPDDPRYPYSQPRAYVYKREPSPAVAAFLGFATAAEGKSVIQAARLQEAQVVAATVAGEPVPTPTAAVPPTATLATTSTETTQVPATTGATGEAETGEAEAGAAATGSPEAVPPTTTEGQGLPAWLWWLLPIAGLGALAWGLSRRGGDGAIAEPPAASPPSPEPAPVPPVPPVATTPPDAEPLSPPEPALANGAATEAEATPPVMPQPVTEAVSTPEPAPEATPPAPAPVAAAAPAPMSEPEPEPESEVAPSSPEPILRAAPATPTPVAAVPHTPPDDVAASPASANHPPLEPVVMGVAAGFAAGVAATVSNTEEQSDIEASKFDVVGRPSHDVNLADVDSGLADLPDGYGESRIVLMPRDPRWAYTYWDTPREHKEDLRRQGGQNLALRLYDVTDVDLEHQNPHSVQQYDCEEMARDWYLPIPVSDRDYLCEIGYLTPDGRWLLLARSNVIRIPPVFPSDWTEDHSMTVGWDEDLRGKTLMTLTHPSQRTGDDYPIHEDIFDLAQSSEAQRVAGSLFGSMHHVPGSMVPQQVVSSYVFPSGMGMVPTISGMVPNVSGLTMSGVGFSASMPPIGPRKFWLVADAELIVYGATEPDASVTIGGKPIQLSEDGTFRFQMSFQDGEIDYPIMAVAVDGEQARSVHMHFERETPERHTNTRDEAQEEWPS